MLTQCKSIIYNPLAWIHPQRFTLPERFDSPRCRSVINEVLLRQYQLPIEEIDLGNSKERFLVSGWPLLARAAFMAASQRHRAMLARNGIFTRLDKATRQFALAELTPALQATKAVDFEFLWQSARLELEIFATGCTATIRSRLELLFPETVSLPNLRAPTQDNELLIRMAIQNAKRAA